MRARTLLLVSFVGLGVACATGSDDDLDPDGSSSSSGGRSSSSGRAGSSSGRTGSSSGRTGSSSGRTGSSSGSEGSSSGDTSSSSSSGGASSGSNDGGLEEDGGALTDGGTPTDGGSDGGDTPDPTNVVLNGSFEQWAGGEAVSWHGSTTTANVTENSAAAHEGQRSAKITVPNTAHKRFSTAARQWQAGRYQCTYWARGSGKVRNAYFDGDYSAYTGYTTLSNADWRSLTYSFTLAQTAQVELIFSAQSTSGEGLSIDDVTCARQP